VGAIRKRTRRRRRAGRTRPDVIRLEQYKRRHRGVIRRFAQESFIFSADVTLDDPKGGYLKVHGQIQCLGGLNIDVQETLKVVSRGRGNVRVRRTHYGYNVSVSGRGNRFRYDSGHPDHSRHDHVHEFDKEGRQVSKHDIHDENEVPDLGDMIGKTRDFYRSPEFAQENGVLLDDDSDDGGSNL